MLFRVIVGEEIPRAFERSGHLFHVFISRVNVAKILKIDCSAFLARPYRGGVDNRSGSSSESGEAFLARFRDSFKEFKAKVDKGIKDKRPMKAQIKAIEANVAALRQIENGFEEFLYIVKVPCPAVVRDGGKPNGGNAFFYGFTACSGH